MNPFAFLKKQNAESSTAPKTSEAANETDDDEEINFGAKVKIIAAMLVVAVATYVALWVQEPTELKSDVLGGSEVTESVPASAVADTSETIRVAAADTQDFAVLAEVSITDFTFTPANLTVKKGTTVVWTNMDPVDHTVTSDTFSSNALEPGDSFDYTFDETGEYAYSCSFHPQMTGKVIVIDESTAEAAAEDAEADEATADDTSVLTEEDALPSIAVMEDYRAAADDEDTLTLSEEDLAAMLAEAEVAEDEPRIVTLSAEDAADSESLKAAAAVAESDKLAKSGPEDVLYAFIFAAILYVNRRKIQNALR